MHCSCTSLPEAVYQYLVSILSPATVTDNLLFLNQQKREKTEEEHLNCSVIIFPENTIELSRLQICSLVVHMCVLAYMQLGFFLMTRLI